MNEPKRRGRPPKAKAEEALSADRAMDAYRAAHPEIEAAKQAQEYALRLWNNQSPDLSRHERLGRISDALKAQGLSMEGVELP